ncbi:MAG: transglycosylase SLT domain-containing protein [Clostridia bacterium]|nr:transglycosylase SLT domain-containing protein [Clostridia bacterium]
MNSKASVRNSIAVLVIVLLSIAGGFIFDRVAKEVKRDRYPRDFETEVRSSAEANGLPENTAFACIKLRSDFSPALLTEDDSGDMIGLFQLTESDYIRYYGGEPGSSGLLYEPATNIETGCRLVSALFEKYAGWDEVWAAMYAGESTVDAWLSSGLYSDASGRLKTVPDSDTADYVKRMNETLEKYEELYPSK